ncbi:6720_t:CDS:2 [Entrophospora sp. SA101]|nr:6720_t:CDS:2 [Entrophospora sp. SA101]CAJ0900795.1 1273_t:CDS:2 [Entrophospora sp. SA101]
MNYFNNSSNDTSNNNNSSNQRTVFFIDTSNPEVNQTISACGSNPFIKPPFPPVIDIRELIIKLTNGKLPAKSPNAFIIYRKAFLDTACANGYKLPMTVISTMVSKSWESEPQYVKDEYKKLSKEAFNRLNEMNPKSTKPNKREQDMLLSATSNDYQSSSSSSSPPDIDNLYEQQNFVNSINSFVQPQSSSSSESEIFSDVNNNIDNIDELRQFINICEQQNNFPNSSFNENGLGIPCYNNFDNININDNNTNNSDDLLFINQDLFLNNNNDLFDEFLI